MSLITIPFDYDSRRYSASLVPIYLNDTDDNGEIIFRGWIDAVVPVQDKLRALSRRVLGDVWRVSEVTDLTVHHLWHRHRENIGCYPSFNVYRTAKRTAHRLEDPGGREHLALNLSLDDLDGYRRDAIIGDTADTEGEYGLNLDLKRVEGRLKKMAKRDELEVYMMIRAGYHWYEIGQRLGENPNTVYRRFRRMLQRISDFV